MLLTVPREYGVYTTVICYVDFCLLLHIVNSVKSIRHKVQDTVYDEVHIVLQTRFQKG